ncbi:MAG: hypothetical protein HW421_939 [Ignavibacteria bacterium]|nr:hypothetical protein [Ignavibacteria bacterium]
MKGVLCSAPPPHKNHVIFFNIRYLLVLFVVIALTHFMSLNEAKAQWYTLCKCQSDAWVYQNKSLEYYCPGSQTSCTIYYVLGINEECNEYFISVRWFTCFPMCTGWTVRDYYNLVVQEVVARGPLGGSSYVNLTFASCWYSKEEQDANGIKWITLHPCSYYNCCHTTYDVSTNPPSVIYENDGPCNPPLDPETNNSCIHVCDPPWTPKISIQDLPNDNQGNEKNSEESDFNYKLALFPNRPGDVISLSLKSDYKGKIDIYISDIEGKIIFKNHFISNNSADVAFGLGYNLESGIYFYQIILDDGRKYTGKINNVK